MLYNRQIKYLDYYENGTKVSAGGFAKLEVRDNTLRIEVTVKGLHSTDSFERDIVLQGSEKEEALGQIRIQNGSGQFRYSCGIDQEIGTTGIAYSELRGIRISIGGTREILCQWDNVSDKRRITQPEESIQEAKPDLQRPGKEPVDEGHIDKKADTGDSVYTESDQPRMSDFEKADKAEVKKEKFESEEDKDRSRENKDVDRDRGRENKDKNREDKDGEGQENKEVKADTVKEREKQESKESDSERSETGEDVRMYVQPGMTEMQAQGAPVNSDVISPQFSEEPPQTVFQSEGQPQDQVGYIFTGEDNRAERVDAQKAPAKLMEDKWQQLSAMYPHIQPFRDERDYLSLTPSDFILFPNRFYRAVNNSFLLHGYYNYHHLILARIEHRGEVLYYIGVPGNYFEREKQVAIMFGFESFECESEPAKTGDFGYYMMRTEL